MNKRQYSGFHHLQVNCSSDRQTVENRRFEINIFVATNIPHANQTIQPEKRNAIYLWEYTKSTEPAFNCRLHSIMMFELLSSVGITATYITCMPQDSNDTDCHVVNQVWLPELGKWVMIDSDSGGFFATDDEGNLLSLQEMREAYIKGNPILYHPQFTETGSSDSWYYDYFFRAFEQTHPDPYSAFGGERTFYRKVKSLRPQKVGQIII